MLSTYPAYFYKEENGYSVIFPDLNYAATQGDTIEEAEYMAKDCLACVLYWLDEEGKEYPPASITAVSPEDLAKELEFDYLECFVKDIYVDVKEYAEKHFDTNS